MIPDILAQRIRMVEREDDCYDPEENLLDEALARVLDAKLDYLEALAKMLDALP
jgi:hypothetical protein